MQTPRLADLKATAQESYTDPPDWHDTPWGHAWADVDHHTVSVMVKPLSGNRQIVIIRNGRQEPLEPVDLFATAYQMAMEL